jgi:hypothetical protein
MKTLSSPVASVFLLAGILVLNTADAQNIIVNAPKISLLTAQQPSEAVVTSVYNNGLHSFTTFPLPPFPLRSCSFFSSSPFSPFLLTFPLSTSLPSDLHDPR